MALRSAGSRFAAVLGLGALVVLVTLLSSWRSIALEYHLRRLRNDSAYFFDVLEEPGQGPRREALRRFLELSDGKERLFLAFLNEVLGLQGHQLSWSFGGDHGPGSLNESSMGLLWIGPKTGGLQPAGENLAKGRTRGRSA